MDTKVNPNVLSLMVTGMFLTHSPFLNALLSGMAANAFVLSGIISGLNSAVPMSTLTFSIFPSSPGKRVRVLIPESVSTVISVLSTMPWSYAYFPTHLMPFPHILPREPSKLYISIIQSATLEGLMNITPSPPIPKCLSESLIASSPGFCGSSSKQFIYT